jgi:hypothetical protein
MKRLLALFLATVLGAPLALAQDVVHGTAQVAYVRIKNPDGTYSIGRPGFSIPITITRVDPRGVVTPVGGAKVPPNVGKPPKKDRNIWPAATTVYQNDSGSYYVCDQGPSCLDDLVQSAAGNNKAWKLVDFGVHLTSADRSGKFLVRWRGFETYTAGLGPGVMAFSDEFFDAGFYLQRSTFPPGPPEGATYLVQGDLSLAPVFIVPNQTCFLAFQFREPHPGGPSMEDGEGPFTNEWTVYSDLGPQIGTSEDLFWYDSPADGIYDETEPDNFGPEFPGAGNFLFKAQVGTGNTTTIQPFSYQWFRGNYQSGNIGSLWFNDANYNVAKAGLVLFPSEPPAQLIAETFSPTFTPVGLRLDVDAKVNTPGLNMRIEMFNFSTNQYVQLWSGPVGTTDQYQIAFASTPAQFVQPGTAVMRAKVSFYRTGLTLVWPWTASVDLINWVVTNS